MILHFRLYCRGYAGEYYLIDILEDAESYRIFYIRILSVSSVIHIVGFMDISNLWIFL
jgi:hypothetical protein